MNKAIVVAELSKVSYYADVLKAEIVKDVFDADLIIENSVNLETSFKDALAEIKTDTSVTEATEYMKFSRMYSDIVNTMVQL